MHTQNSPTLSICIPTYNRAELLVALLLPILRNFPTEIEICISDNGSSNQNIRILKQLKNDFPNILLHLNNENMGIDRNMELALKMATGKFIWLIGDDDHINATHLPDLITLLRKKTADILFLDESNTADYSRLESIFLDRWYRMPLGSFIISNKVATLADFCRYYHTYHAYSGIVWDFLSCKSSPASHIDFSNPRVFERGEDAKKTYDDYKRDVYVRAIPLWFQKLPQILADPAEKLCRIYLKHQLQTDDILWILQKREALPYPSYKQTHLSTRIKFIAMQHPFLNWACYFMDFVYKRNYNGFSAAIQLSLKLLQNQSPYGTNP